MAQWIKHLLYKPELIPGAHVNMEGERTNSTKLFFDFHMYAVAHSCPLCTHHACAYNPEWLSNAAP